MSKKLFKPFDVNLFFPQQCVRVQNPLTPRQTPVSCFISAPPDESAGVTKVVPSPPVCANQTADLLLMLTATDEGVGGDDAGEKKSKKDKKDKKKKRKASEDADDEFMFPSAFNLLKTAEEKKAEVIKFAAERGLTVSFDVPPPSAGHVPKTKSYEADVEFETYMAGSGNFANAHLKSAHAQDLATMPSGGKSLGDKKYGCVFCGSLHHLECHQKGNDPPCLSKGAFNRFIQNFLFEYDIAPDQEWRQMLQFKVTGYRRVMAERFASLVANTADPEWTGMMHRRSWEMRKQTFSSNAGTTRELHHQGRASEFLFFHAQGGSTSPRPPSTLTVPQMGSMGSFVAYGGGAGSPLSHMSYGFSPVPPADLTFSHVQHF